MFDPVVPGPRTSRAWNAALLAQAVAVGPGPVAIGLLEQVDAELLSGHDRVVFLTTWQAQVAWVTSRSYAAILPVVGAESAIDPDPDDEGGPLDLGPFECAEEARHAEVAAACRLSTVAASDRITTARFLAGPGAPVAGMLETGAWGYGHLSAVVSETAELSAALTEKVVQTVVAETLPDADGQPSRYAEETPGRLRHRIRRTILRIDAAAAAQRAKKRRRERSLRISPLPDFRAKITLEASQPMASWAWRQFDTWARTRQNQLKDPAADLTALLGPCTCPRDTDARTGGAGSPGSVGSAGLVGTLAALRGHRQPAGSGTGAGATDNPQPDRTWDRTHQLGCPHHPDTTLEALRADAVIEAARLLMRTLGHDSDDAPPTTGSATGMAAHGSSAATAATATTGSGTTGSGTTGSGTTGRDTAGGTGADTGAGAGAGAGTGPGSGAAAGAGAGRGRSWSSAVVIVDAATLLGLANNPGWVPGHGWVPAPLARELAASADAWRAFLTDHGRLVATGSTRY